MLIVFVLLPDHLSPHHVPIESANNLRPHTVANAVANRDLFTDVVSDFVSDFVSDSLGPNEVAICLTDHIGPHSVTHHHATDCD